MATQYTARSDSTRVRASKVFSKHTYAKALKFLDHLINWPPSGIKCVHTDNDHEFQSKFHWHAQDYGILHRYIKPVNPHLNGKVERTHLTDKTELYQLLKYKGE